LPPLGKIALAIAAGESGYVGQFEAARCIPAILWCNKEHEKKRAFTCNALEHAVADLEETLQLQHDG
jgi:hypothetical protein